MNETQALAYVQATAQAVNLPLDAAQAQRVAAYLAVNARIAGMLDNVPLAPHDELVEIYCPKPFSAQ
jgi:Protein of unknown function (DUF4089)